VDEKNNVDERNEYERRLWVWGNL